MHNNKKILALVLALTFPIGGCAIKSDKGFSVRLFSPGSDQVGAPVSSNYKYVQTADESGKEVRSEMRSFCEEGKFILAAFTTEPMKLLWSEDMTAWAKKEGIALAPCKGKNPGGAPPKIAGKKTDGLVLKCERSVLFLEQWRGPQLVWERSVPDLALQDAISLGSCR